MAKISTYSVDNLISVDDKLIGTDAENSNLTKNFLIGDLSNFISSNITNLGIPYTGATQDINIGSHGINGNWLEFGDVSVYQSLYIDQDADISLNGDTGNSGDIILSQGAGNNPIWQNQTTFFANAVLTLPTYASNAAALAGGLVQGQLYKSSAGVVSIVL